MSKEEKIYKVTGIKERQEIKNKNSEWDKSMQKILKATGIKEIQKKLSNSDRKLKWRSRKKS